MIDFTHYVTGSDIAKCLTREPDDLIECLVQIRAYLKANPDNIAGLHSAAVENEACTALRALGAILINFQGD